MRDSIHVPVLALSVVLFACSSPGGSTSGLGNSGGSDAVDDASAVTDGDAAQATDAATINATQDGNTASDSAVALKDSAGGQTQKDSAGGDATTNCSPTTKGSCGQNGYCKGSSCTKCPLGKHNCDGVGDCESSAACGITKCDKTCTDANESHCVKNPAQKNRECRAPRPTVVQVVEIIECYMAPNNFNELRVKQPSVGIASARLAPLGKGSQEAGGGQA